jgi:hypothetical protein
MIEPSAAFTCHRQLSSSPYVGYGSIAATLPDERPQIHKNYPAISTPTASLFFHGAGFRTACQTGL